jgi:hypothetical protein
MKYESFTKVAVQNFRAELNSLLADFGEKHGIEVSLGNARFTSNEVRFINSTYRIKGSPKRVEKLLETQLAKNGLREVNDYGDRLVEYNPRRYAYPFVYVKAFDGKRYKCSLDYAKHLGF